MILNFDTSLAANYKSPPQKIRVMSEPWLAENGYCPICGGKLIRFKNNKAVDDFYCENCKEEFELKTDSKKYCTFLKVQHTML